MTEKQYLLKCRWTQSGKNWISPRNKKEYSFEEAIAIEYMIKGKDYINKKLKEK